MIESSAIELIENKPWINKILKKLSKALESGEKDDFFEQIDSLADYIDQKSVNFWDKNDISDYIHRDSQPNSTIRWYMDMLDDDEILFKYRLKEISEKIDELNVYHQMIFEYQTELAKVESQWAKLHEEKRWLWVIWIDKRIEANSRITNRYKEQIKYNQEKKEQAETPLYLLRAMKRYLESKIENSPKEIIKLT